MIYFCWLQVVTVLFHENFVTLIQAISLSSRINTRKTEILAAENKNSLLELLHKSPSYAVALDESCDIIDDGQMSICVQSFDNENKIFINELLAILTFKDKTREENINFY